MPRWKKILFALLAVAATGALVAGAWYAWSYLNTCQGDVKRIEDECVGVDAEGYDFGNPEIREVAEAIAEENKAIGNADHVTVAMMLPLQHPERPWLRRQMRSDLQGAYLGQRAANDDEGDLPKIRLVLANPGRDYRHQEPVVDRLLEMARSREDNLRAVTGFNLSRKETRAAVARLTREGVPVLASRISSSHIANKESASGKSDERFPGLARILPTNDDAARALADFHDKKDRRDEQTVLVYDKRKDLYSNSLEDAFRGIDEERASAVTDDVFSFRSPSNDDAGETGTNFTGIADNICGGKTDTVYFAGRTLHLKIFARKLADRCGDQQFTIISGSDAASLPQAMSADKGEDWKNLADAKVTVQYAAPAHPQAWCSELARWKELAKWKETRDFCSRHGLDRAEIKGAPQDGPPPWYVTEPAEAQKRLYEQIEEAGEAGTDIGPLANLDDSRTMLVYDGLVTIREALHKIVNTDEEEGAEAKAVPSLEALRNFWTTLRNKHRVAGTSGLICLTDGGNPYDKPVSVVELDPAKKGLRFRGLAWPEGGPQEGICKNHGAE